MGKEEIVVNMYKRVGENIQSSAKDFTKILNYKQNSKFAKDSNKILNYKPKCKSLRIRLGFIHNDQN